MDERERWVCLGVLLILPMIGLDWIQQWTLTAATGRFKITLQLRKSLPYLIINSNKWWQLQIFLVQLMKRGRILSQFRSF